MDQKEAASLLLIGRTYLSELENGREPGATLEARLDALSHESTDQLRARIDKSKQSPAGVRVVKTTDDGKMALYRFQQGMSPREKLRATLEARKLSLAQLAKLTKYSAGVLEHVVNGTGRISEKMAKAIVRELPELEVDELLDGSDTPRVLDESGITGTHGATPPWIAGRPPERYVPLVSWTAAGQLVNACALDEAYDHEGVATSVPGKAFALEVRGDSMHPEINAGDVVVVRADASARPGDVVVVRTIHGDVVCKRYQTKEGGKLVILSSVNRSYEPIEIPASEVAWVYPVKELKRRY